MDSVFIKYLYQCRRCILGLVLCLGIFSGTFVMFHIRAEVIWYPVLLCLVTGLVLFLSGFLSFWRKHRELMRIQASIGLLWSDLPAPQGPAICGGQRPLMRISAAARRSLTATLVRRFR